MTNDPLLAALKAEEARLQTELEKLPTYRKLVAVRETMERLAPLYGENTSGTLPVSVGNRSTIVRRRRRHLAGTTSLASLVREVATRELQNHGKRISSSDIVPLLELEGRTIAAKKPQSVVASILSHDPMFDNTKDERGVGYGLAEWSSPKEETRTGGDKPQQQAENPDPDDHKVEAASSWLWKDTAQ